MNPLQSTLKIKQEELANPYGLFRNEDGAIDLASIMVGVIVIGLIGGVIAATVFAVIPWAQDSAAKHQLESIHTAENAYFGFSSAALSSLPAGAKQNSFTSSVELEVAGLLAQNKNYCAAASADNKTYMAYSLSATGRIWVSDDKKSKPTVFRGSTLPAVCADLAAAATDLGKYAPSTATPKGDIDGDGIPNATDTDLDGDGIPNDSDMTPDGIGATEDLSTPGYGDGTTAATIGTITGDGSSSYFPKNTGWLSAYGPVMPNTLPSPILDLGGWSYNATNRSVVISFKTDGTFTGVGGSWIYMVQADISCYDPPTKTYIRRADLLVSSLHGPYASSRPGPHSGAVSIDCGDYAPATAIPSQVLVRQATDAQWANYSLGRLGYVYSLPGLSEGWVNRSVPQE
jgi:type II secretory pathway pseudopilin PulG